MTIKLTERQAKMIEDLKVSEITKIGAYNVYLALIGHYEVEPEFHINDWIVHRFGDIGRVTSVEGNGVHADNGMGGHMDYFRHATESEISQEKERRFWKKHGRDVWELQVGDIVLDFKYDTIRIINDVRFSSGIKMTQYLFDEWIDKDIVVEQFKIICFVEDRLDVNHDDE